MAVRSKPVDVIAVYGADGSIQPLRLQVQDPESGCYQLKIQRVIRQREQKTIGMEAHFFLCSVSFCGRQIPMELQYHIRSHSWRWIMHS